MLAGRHPVRHWRRAADHLQGRPQLVAGQEGRRRRVRGAHPLAGIAGETNVVVFYQHILRLLCQRQRAFLREIVFSRIALTRLLSQKDAIIT